MTLLATHDDPQTALDFQLCDLAEEIESLERKPAEHRSPYRDRIADMGAALSEIARQTPRQGD